MKTIVHIYNYDISKERDRLAYEELCGKLADTLPRRMVSWGGDSHYKTGLDGVTVTLEDKFLFHNQWNAHDAGGKSYRLFDWAEDDMHEGSKIKRGHWLEITSEMTAIRNEISVCGYCGAYEPTVTHGGKFCPHCLDSEYLDEGSLHLTRMRPVSATGNRPPLTEDERKELLPKFIEAQIYGISERGKERIAKKREEVEAKYQNQIALAKTERDGFLWAMDHGISLDLVIF